MPMWTQVFEYKPGMGFGEIALLNCCQRTATIYCTEDSQFATLNRHNEVVCEVLNYQSRELQNFLSNFDIFQWWIKKERLNEVIAYFDKVTGKNIGDFIYKKGQKTDCVYF